VKSADELWQEIDRYTVRPGTVVLWWLYQAGVVCKTPAGVVAVIDPYLSDAVTRSYGSRRNVPPPLDPGQVRPTRCSPAAATRITSIPTRSRRS
jgi:hypothetical protein